MAILAHRGITAVARDNSFIALESVSKAVSAGLPLGIEVDIRKTLDALVMNHDPTESQAVLARTDLAGMRELFSHTDLITLSVALDLLVGVPVVNLEIKEPSSVNVTIDALHTHCDKTGHAIESFVVSSCVPWVISEVKRRDARVTTGLLIDRNLPAFTRGTDAVLQRLQSDDDTLDATTEWALRLVDITDADFLHTHWSLASPRLLDEIVQRNKRMVFWTVNDKLLIEYFSGRSEVAHVITDYPHLVFDELTPERPHRKSVDPEIARVRVP